MLCKTRLIASVLLFFLLAVSAQAMVFGPRQAAAPRQESLLDTLWSRVLSLIGSPAPAPARPDRPAASPEKEGPQMDPNGGK